MNVYLDLRLFWLKDGDGFPRSVHSIWLELQGTENAVQRQTLSLASKGLLDRGRFCTQEKLRRIASVWVGREVKLEEIMRLEAG